MRLVVVLLLSSCSLASFAASPRPDMAVFGQVLNEPLSLPECEKRKESWEKPDAVPKRYAIGNKNPTCWQTFTPYAETPEPFDPNGSVTLVFPSPERPAVMGTDKTKLRLQDGRVVAVEMDTGGIDRQETVARALLEKYGKPHSLERTTVRNRMGATFAVGRATWTFPGLHVFFDPVGDTLDEGSLTIKTDTAYRADEQKSEDKKAARKKL